MLTLVWSLSASLINELDKNLGGFSPAFIIAGTVSAVLLIQNATRIRHAYNYVRHGNANTRDIKKSLIDKSYALANKVPILSDKIQSLKNKEINKFLSAARVSAIENIKQGGFTQLTMPKDPVPAAEILETIATDLQVHNRKGRQSGAVYADHDEGVINLLGEVYKLTAFTNPMHSTWPKINAMEAQLLQWFHHLFNNPYPTSPDELPRRPPGVITDGGTTSILEACRAHVRYAKKDKGIVNPVIIVPETAYVAFDNAADVLGVRLIKVPVNKKTGAADVAAMEKYITRDTCLIVGSAPSFPCGVFDPIEALAKVAIEHKIPLHVDACLGGFFNIFSKKAGYPVPRFDFAIPGVSSISADPHKYGEAPKGSSVLLFHPHCLATPVFSSFDWSGGIYVTPGIKGSRRGDAIASLWAVLNVLGEDHYVNVTRELMELTTALATHVRKIPGIVLRYDPQFPVVTFDTEEGINCLLVVSELANVHWDVTMINPTGFHFCLTHVQVKTPNFLEDFITDLTAAVNFARQNPKEKPKNMAKVYGALGEMTFPSQVLKEVGERYVAINTTLPDLTFSDWEHVADSKEVLRPSLR